MTNSKPCECSLWLYRDGNSEVTTGCTQQVSGKRRFRQGHDAVLKSLLIRAGIAGVDVKRSDGRQFGPTTAAELYGFGHMVSAGISKGRAKATAVADRQSKAAQRKVGAALEVKVGRWWYPVISMSGGRVAYADRQGGEARLAPKAAQVREV